MRDVKTRVIYVGKALSLYNRVPNYFHAANVLPEHIAAMVDRVFDFDVITTANEKEALVLENTLIKRHKPRFNILLRDDKNYLYVKLPVNEEFPRVYTVRRAGSDGAKYYGPYTNAIALRSTLKTVRRVVPYRTCTDHEFALHRPCFYYHLKLCTAPCAGFQTRDEYHQQLDQIALFLEGKSDDLVTQLKQQMTDASDATKFEAAARIRDRLQAIETMAQRQRMLALGQFDQDLFGLARADGQAMVTVFSVREGKLSGSENFELVGLGGEQTEAEAMNAFVSQYYASATHIPKEVFVPASLPDGAVIEQWLSERRGSHVNVRVPQRGRHRELLAQAAANAQEAMRQLRIKLDYDEQSFSAIPDLVLIDGGKGQLSAAREVLEGMGLERIPTFGLAKEQEELFEPNRSDPIRLPLDSEALFLVQRIRDEAHRFAITFHRVVRRKDAFASVLDGITGLGPVRKRALLRAFGSIDSIRNASVDDLKTVKGITRQVAVAIKEMV